MKKTRKLYGRNFDEDDVFQDDDVYWKLYDIIVLRDQKAIYRIKESHQNYKKRKKNGNLERSTG